MSATRLFRIFLVLVALSLVKHAWLARYCHPMGDDWSYAVQGMTKDFGPWLVGEYQHWNGRYFSNILVGRGPLVLGLDHLWLYRVVPVLLMLLTLVAFQLLVNAVTGKALERWKQWAAALLLFTVYIQGMPDIGEGFYWYTGAVTYQLGSVLMLCYAAAFIAFVQGRIIGGRTTHTLFLVILAVLVIGSSEVHMVLMVAFHALFFVLRWKQGVPVDRSLLAIAAVIIAGSAVMMMAPGNAVRGSNFPEQHQLLHSLWWSTMQTGRFFSKWVLDSSLVLLSFLFIPLYRPLAERVPLLQRSFHLTPLWSTLLLVGVIFLCVFPAYWSTGILGQHRTLNVAYILFIPLWFVNLMVWANTAIGRRVERNEREFHWPEWAAYLLILFAITTMHNGGKATEDLFTGRAERFDRQLQQRYELLEHAGTTQEEPIMLPEIKDPAESLYLLELRPDPSDWVNNAYVHYFQLDGRHIVPTTLAGSELR